MGSKPTENLKIIRVVAPEVEIKGKYWDG